MADEFLDGRIVIVTGGGMGVAMTLGLAAAGARVGVVCKSLLGKADVLVNNAGIGTIAAWPGAS